MDPSDAADVSHWHPGKGLARRLTAPGPYGLTRFAILRLLGLVYLMAFLTAAFQLIPLVGESGLTPVGPILDRLTEDAGGAAHAFWARPSLFFFGHSDGAIVFWSWVGVGLSAAVFAGYANGLMMIALWAIYLSIDHIGLRWYGFGWESQLLETGFLAIFLCPLLDGRPFSARPPPKVVIWLFWWLIFRIMLGAGLIKIRGDDCWRDLTCLIYHYETQPIPHPLSWLLHQAPAWFHQFGVLYNHLVELVCPFLIVGPRRVRHLAASLMLVFQIMLILSGNLSFLNWLTLIPVLALFDDGVWRRLMPARWTAAAQGALDVGPGPNQTRAAWGLCVLVATLSVVPTLNLFSPGQVMNASFDRLSLVNTYGAFGSVGQTRPELVFEGTTEETITPDTAWREFDFKCKPDRVDEAPCLITPYHRRLDWLLWFAAMSSPNRHPWVVHLVYKLLERDPDTLSLLGRDPFPDTPPRWIRVTRYRYTFTDWAEAGWWRRERMGPYLPPIQAGDMRVQRLLERLGWRPPMPP